MTFTALHRLLGDPPRPLTSEMVDSAVAQGLRETDDLDWKSELPPLGAIPSSDFPKDVAAMANSGGGTLIFGVTENGKAASGRKDTGDLTERYERGLRSAAVTAISPPIFGLEVVQLGEPGNRCVVVVIPASVDGPHLIYRNEYFGAPIRNDADTVWMKERQIEAMYRARFDERRRSTDVLDKLYSEAAAMRSANSPAWIVAVAHPRLPATVSTRPDQSMARQAFEEAGKNALVYVGRGSLHPLEHVDRSNPRPGLRRWTARPSVEGDRLRWLEAWISVHDDGSVSLTAAVGGHRNSSTEYNDDSVVESRDVEVAIADFMGLIREASNRLGLGEYEVRVGFEWTGDDRLQIWTTDNMNFPYSGSTIPLARYTPVETTVRADANAVAFYWQVHDLALDCVNEGGIAYVRTISPPAPE
ncbi:AlbA family DNA-binding domain-containing protein [Agromyces protaetiae]|uniref:AlbA family DNA-binding domain-containing protein n=1 Tax=Agromyces protaetiae TaxID=2509455 RepID=UPI0013EC30AE|nr:ATP-binding protein [Agromyces protaetiae]